MYTKAYDLFKKFNPGATRLTLYIAYHIALSYHTSGKFDMAVRCALFASNIGLEGSHLRRA